MPASRARGSAVMVGEERSASAEQRLGMRHAIVGQTFGALGYLTLTNGLLLLYLTKNGFGSAPVMLLLALPHVIQALLIMPFSYKADREGRKRFTVRGAMIGAFGFILLAAAGSCATTISQIGIVIGIGLFAIGQAMLTSGWFALLSPMVPPAMRGSFFGRLRVTWQTSGFFFGIACTFILTKESPMLTLQAILAVAMIGMFVRVLFFVQLPELETPIPESRSMLAASADVLRAPGYASFCCYAFLITLVTFSAPNLFVLIEKQTLHYGDQRIVWMGNLLMLGSVFGFLIGGRMVDRKGTKFVFLLSHFSFGLVLFSFLLRDLVPVPMMYWTGLLNFLYGAVQAASSIAISTEMLALIPPASKALSTGLCSTLLVAGNALSGMLVSGAIALGIFREGWLFIGTP
ncbi:MAG: MFS transporter, partial [Planctomycetes bacterium]|nr:MFS transporter [Planctomycetota bacterium]